MSFIWHNHKLACNDFLSQLKTRLHSQIGVQSVQLTLSNFLDIFVFENFLRIVGLLQSLVKTSVMPKCMNGWQNCHSRICVGAIANRLPMGPGM